jgi:hypothetical protein
VTQSGGGNVAQLDDACRHLLLSFPDPELPYEGSAVVDHVVEVGLHAAVERRGVDSIIIAADIQAEIFSVSGLRYETAELVAALGRLANRRVDRDWFCSIGDKLSGKRDRDSHIQRKWEHELQQRHGLLAMQTASLWTGLQQLVASILNTHAAEAAAFLYQGHDAEKIGFSAAVANRFPIVDSFVPADLRQIARTEYPQFFDRDDDDRRHYLADRVQAAFAFHLLSIDPQASELVQANVREKTLYLDTNFLYRLLGIHGPALAHGPAITIEISEALNCRLLVARETVDEFVRSLRAEMNRVRTVPIERSDYQRIAATQHGGDWAFAQAYYREVASGAVRSVDEFDRKYSNVRAILSRWKVEVDEDAFLSEEESLDPDFKDLWSALNQWHNDSKGSSTIDHDVFLLRNIRRRRTSQSTTLAQVDVWLLTYDRGLTAFSAHRTRRGGFSPCILADSWLQIARPFFPRTTDYERAFVSMLQHPLLATGSSVVPFDHVSTALNRLERYRELPPQLVAAMVADGEFHRRLGEARDPEAERQVIELTVQRLAKDAVARAEAAEERLSAAVTRIDTLEESMEALREERDRIAREAEERLVGATEQQHSLRAELNRVPSAIQAAIEAAVHEARQQTEAHLREKQNHAVRWIVYFLISGVTLSATLFSMLANAVPLFSVAGIVALAWWLLLAVFLLVLPLWHRAGHIASVGALLLALLGAAGLTYQLLEHARGRDGKQGSSSPDVPAQ